MSMAIVKNINRPQAHANPPAPDVHRLGIRGGRQNFRSCVRRRTALWRQQGTLAQPPAQPEIWLWKGQGFYWFRLKILKAVLWNKNEYSCTKLIVFVFKYNALLTSMYFKNNTKRIKVHSCTIYHSILQLNLKDAMPVSFRSELFTSYILTIFKQRNLLP